MKKMLSLWFRGLASLLTLLVFVEVSRAADLSGAELDYQNQRIAHLLRGYRGFERIEQALRSGAMSAEASREARRGLEVIAKEDQKAREEIDLENLKSLKEYIAKLPAAEEVELMELSLLQTEFLIARWEGRRDSSENWSSVSSKIFMGSIVVGAFVVLRALTGMGGAYKPLPLIEWAMVPAFFASIAGFFGGGGVVLKSGFDASEARAELSELKRFLFEMNNDLETRKEMLSIQ